MNCQENSEIIRRILCIIAVLIPAIIVIFDGFHSELTCFGYNVANMIFCVAFAIECMNRLIDGCREQRTRSLQNSQSNNVNKV